MAEITAALIRSVRERTGAGMSDVKKALVDAGGDETQAIEQLRIKGASKGAKLESRTAGNGLVAAALDGAAPTLLELNCETDFVAKSETFQALAADLAAHVAKSGVTEPAALLDEPFGGATVKSALTDASVALGEKFEVGGIARFGDTPAGGYVASYLHRTAKDLPPTIGVLVEVTGGTAAAQAQVGKDLAQHISFSAPRYLRREDVPADVVAAERRVAEQIAKEEGKPEAALPKIVEGRVGGFLKDICLLEQGWVREPKKTIATLAQESGVTITRFARVRVGQA